MSVLTDIDFSLDPLSNQLFPGIPNNLQVHGGFADAHAETANIILAETKRLIASKGATTVTLVRANRIYLRSCRKAQRG